MHMEAELLLVVRPEQPRSDAQGTTIAELTRLSGMSTGLANRWQMVAADARKLEEDKQALVQANSGGKLKKKFKLNVGGTIFKNVKRETLCLVPERNLAQLFSGRWEQLLLRACEQQRLAVEVLRLGHHVLHQPIEQLHAVLHLRASEGDGGGMGTE